MRQTYGIILAASCISVGACLAQPIYAQTVQADALVKRAQLLDGQGRHDLASQAWTQVLTVKPMQPDALAALASFSKSKGDNAAADHYLSLLRQAAPQDPRIAMLRSSATSDDAGDFQEASALAERHQYAAALQLYRKAFRGNRPSGTWALAYYETQAAVPAEYPQAVAGLRALVKDYPANSGYALVLGKVLTYRAESRLEGVRLLAEVKGSQEQTVAARDAWRQAILWDVNAPAATETVQQYLARFHDTQLEEQVTSARAKQPVHRVVAEGDPVMGEAYAALSKGDLDRSQKLFGSLLSIPAQRGKASLGLGYVAMQRQDFETASVELERAKESGLHSNELRDAMLQARFWNVMNEGERSLAAHDAPAAIRAFESAGPLRPNRPEVLEATARAYMMDKQTERALPLFEQAVRLQQDRSESWIAWFSALVQAGRSREVLADQKYLPASVARHMQDDPDAIATLAVAEMQAGSAENAHRLMSRLDTVKDPGKRAAGQLRCASLLMTAGKPREGAREALEVLRLTPDNVAAWKIVVVAEHQADRDPTALTALRRMPATAYTAAMQDAAFAVTAASVHQSLHQYSEASALLQGARKNAANDAAALQTINLSAASLAASQGMTREAVRMYADLIDTAPDSVDAWAGLIAALHNADQDVAAKVQIEQMPDGIKQRLEGNPAYLQTVASVYTGTKETQQARQALEQARRIYRDRDQPAPYSVEAQLAWLQLASNHDADLATTLRQLGRRNDLSAAELKQTQNLWAAWAIRKAEREEKRGDNKHAASLLEAARQAYPYNADVRRALAGNYIRNGNAKGAVTLYEQIDWNKATKADYVGAIGAASASNRGAEGKVWLASALDRWPGDADLLASGAELARANGDTRKAKEYWQAILRDVPERPAVPSADGAAEGAEMPAPAVNSLERMLAPSNAIASTAEPSRPSHGDETADLLALLPSSTRHDEDVLPKQADGDASAWLVGSNHQAPAPAHKAKRISYEEPTLPQDDATPFAAQHARAAESESSPSAMTFAPLRPGPAGGAQFANASWRSGAEAVAPAEDAASSFPGATDTGASDDAVHVPATALLTAAERKAKDALDDMNSRLSSWNGGGVRIVNRTGTAGFDKLTRTEVTMESSHVLGDGVRMTVLTKPTFLNSGSSDATSTYNFGTSGAPLADQIHYQSGVGGELQIATRSMDASVGFTPTSFYVSQVIGALNIHPERLPVSLGVFRESVTQTMTSYAGEKDPITGSVWGGVVASGVRAALSKGSAASGFYAGGSAAQLTGHHVNDNSRVEGSAGAYWTFLTNPFGTFKAGANVTGMHFDQNQQYFTYGQGGYFSPDSYLLINSPLTWDGRSGRLAYKLNGSVGLQSFREGAALPGSFSVDRAAAQPTTSANYNLAASLAYKLDEHWNLGAFVNVNNSRNYQERSGGFSIRYLNRPQVFAEGSATGLMNELAPRPLLVP